ncbi:MAG: preprotein translocase subunit SecY [Bacillota bacterium]|nr:MAG: preprotein translocase subunit SecY [Bacillota bacterium]
MMESVRAVFRSPGLRNRLLFTLGMLAVFRLGAVIPVPGIDTRVIQELIDRGGLFGLFDVISGGAFRTMSIFAMSVTPYINASIIVQLLTVVIPRWEELSKEGEQGRRKLQEYVRYGTVILGLIQALGMALTIRRAGAMLHPDSWTDLFIIIVTLTAGTAFLMWLGELITEKGIGNGISLLIFAGILSRVPRTVKGTVELYRVGQVDLFQILLVAVLGVLIVAFTVLVTEGVRRIPVQYARRTVGRRTLGGHSTHLPIRVNQAGVIPVIFSQSLLVFPPTVASYFDQTHPVVRWIMDNFNFRHPWYLIAFALLTIGFTYFYTTITFNPVEVADNIRKAGGIVAGLRPGKPTADYLAKVSNRLTFVGALFLAGITVLPYALVAVTQNPNAGIGGTALLIVVGVAIETMRQVEAHLVLRQYQGFMR